MKTMIGISSLIMAVAFLAGCSTCKKCQSTAVPAATSVAVTPVAAPVVVAPAAPAPAQEEPAGEVIPAAVRK